MGFHVAKTTCHFLRVRPLGETPVPSQRTLTLAALTVLFDGVQNPLHDMTASGNSCRSLVGVGWPNGECQFGIVQSAGFGLNRPSMASTDALIPSGFENTMSTPIAKVTDLPILSPNIVKTIIRTIGIIFFSTDEALSAD